MAFTILVIAVLLLTALLLVTLPPDTEDLAIDVAEVGEAAAELVGGGQVRETPGPGGNSAGGCGFSRRGNCPVATTRPQQPGFVGWGG